MNGAKTAQAKRGGLDRLRHASGLALIVSSLWGCAIGPNYHRPTVDLPSEFRDAPIPASTNSLSDLPWWQVFPDPALQELLQTAFTNNYDLRIAISRVDQARALLAQARSEFFPQVGYEAAVSRSRNAVGTTPILNDGDRIDTYSVAGIAAWELDLWGRIRRSNEAARAQLLATDEARRGVMLSLLSDVATSYFQLLALDRALEIARRTTNSFAESLKIFSERLQGGIVSKLETSAAEAALASAAANVPEIERRIVIQENELNALLGRNPGPVPRTTTLLDQSMPDIPPGLPSSLLERRPDVRQAEELLHSANAQVGVAMANFFPRLSLTGLFGQVSPELSAITAGSANAWSIAANLAGPIFQGGRPIAEYRQTKAARAEAQLHYQATVLGALGEVSDALIGRQKFAEAREQQARAVKAYQVAVQVASERYLAGKASYYEVLQEQQLLYPAENELVLLQLNQLLAAVQLYRSLGGGWESAR